MVNTDIVPIRTVKSYCSPEISQLLFLFCRVKTRLDDNDDDDDDADCVVLNFLSCDLFCAAGQILGFMLGFIGFGGTEFFRRQIGIMMEEDPINQVLSA